MYAFLLLCFVHPVAHSTSTKKKLPYQVNLSKRNIPTSSSWRLLFIRRRKSFSFDGVKFINLIACWYLYYNGSWDNSFFWGHPPIIKKESFNEIPCLHSPSLMIFFFVSSPRFCIPTVHEEADEKNAIWKICITIYIAKCWRRRNYKWGIEIMQRWWSSMGKWKAFLN